MHLGGRSSIAQLIIHISIIIRLRRHALGRFIKVETTFLGRSLWRNSNRVTVTPNVIRGRMEVGRVRRRRDVFSVELRMFQQVGAHERKCLKIEHLTIHLSTGIMDDRNRMSLDMTGHFDGFHHLKDRSITFNIITNSHVRT